MSFSLPLGGNVLSEVEEIARAEHFRASNKSLSIDMMVKALLLKCTENWNEAFEENKLIWSGFAWVPKSGRQHTIIINTAADLTNESSGLWKRCKAFQTENPLIKFLELKARESQRDPLDLGPAVWKTQAWKNCPVRNEANHHYVRLLRGVDIGMSNSSVVGGMLFGTMAPLSLDEKRSIGKKMSAHISECARVFSSPVSELQNQVVAKMLLDNPYHGEEPRVSVAVPADPKPVVPAKSVSHQWSSDEVNEIISLVSKIMFNKDVTRQDEKLKNQFGIDLNVNQPALAKLWGMLKSADPMLEQFKPDEANLTIKPILKDIWEYCAFTSNNVGSPDVTAIVVHLRTVSDCQDLIDACKCQESMIGTKTSHIVVISDVPRSCLNGFKEILNATRELNWQICTKEGMV